MAITNPQAVKFSNEKARTLANAIQTMDRTLSQFMLDVVTAFEANTGANADGEVIEDNATLDGRPVVTKVNVAELKFVVEQLQATMAVSDRRAVVNRFVNNGQPLY